MTLIYALWAIELLALVGAIVYHAATGGFRTNQGARE